MDSVKSSATLLERQIADALRASPHLTGQAIAVRYDGGRVALSGHVSSYFQKQMAQESLRRLSGVEHIDNDLSVTRWIGSSA
jgi:osmotically-inducible protein OsmY